VDNRLSTKGERKRAGMGDGSSSPLVAVNPVSCSPSKLGAVNVILSLLRAFINAVWLYACPTLVLPLALHFSQFFKKKTK